MMIIYTVIRPRLMPN